MSARSPEVVCKGSEHVQRQYSQKKPNSFNLVTFLTASRDREKKGQSKKRKDNRDSTASASTLKNHPLTNQMRFQLDDVHDHCQQLYGGDLRHARCPQREELFHNLRAVAHLVLLLSTPWASAAHQILDSLSVTYPPSGMWGGAVTEDDDVRWGPVASVSNGPGVELYFLEYAEPHVVVQRPTWM